MAYRSIESAIRGIVSEDNLTEAALGDYKGLLALAMRKSGDEQSAMKAAAEMMKKGQMKDLNMFMKAMDKSTHKAIMPFVDKKYNKALHEDMEIDEAQKPVSQMTPAEKAAHDARRKEYNEYQKSKRNEEVEIEEKTLTSAELKKREEVATAIERDNPDMPMGKKMAIATSTAKKVAEEVDPNVDMLNEFLSADELGQSMLDEIRGADVEDQHIIMQLRSSQDLEGKKEIRFRNKTSAKVAPKHIDKILKLHDHPSVKPVHKRQIRVAISKSHDHLKKFADQIKEETTNEEAKPDITQQMADKAKKDRIMPTDREKLSKLAGMLKKEETDDKETGDHVRTSDYKMSKVRLPDGRMVYRKVKREIKV